MEDVMKRIEQRKNNVVGKDVKNYFVDLLTKWTINAYLNFASGYYM